MYRVRVAGSKVIELQNRAFFERLILMASATGFIWLLVLIMGVGVICAFILLSACEEITCAFGPLDSPDDARREIRRRVSRNSDGQQRSASAALMGEEPVLALSSPENRKSLGEGYVQRRLSRTS